MAFKMPEYQRQVEQAPVVRQQTQVVNASVAPGLDALGRGISNFGQGLGVYNARREAEERREREKADQLRIRTVLAEVTSGSRDFLETPLDNEGNGGFLNKRGQNAIKASVEDSKVFQRFVEGKLEGLTPEQRALIAPSIEGELRSFQSQVDRHVSQQADVLNKETGEALIANRTNAAVAALVRGDRDAFEHEFGAGLGEVDNIATSMQEPLDSPQHTKRVADYTDHLRRSALEAIVAADPAEAERLFSIWQPSLNQNEVTRTKLGERIKDASDKQHATVIAEDAIMSHGYEAVSMIESMPDVSDDMKRLAVNEATKKIAEADRFQEAADSETLGKISQSISRGQGLYTIVDLERDPDFKRLGKEKARADAYNMVEAQRRARSKNPGERKKQSDINSQAIANYQRRLMENKEVAISADTDSEYSNADQETRDKLGTMRAAAREQLAKQAADSEADFMKVVSAAIPAGLDREEVERRKDAAAAWYQRSKSALGGKEVPHDAVERYIQSKTSNVLTSTWFGMKEMSTWEAEQRKRNIVNPIPEPIVTKPAPAPNPAQPPGTVRMKDERGKTWYIPSDKVAEAEANKMTRF